MSNPDPNAMAEILNRANAIAGVQSTELEASKTVAAAHTAGESTAPGTYPPEAKTLPTEPVVEILQFFESAHLPAHLREISLCFESLAKTLVDVLPRNAERSVALRKLLEAKDAAVRARLAKTTDEGGKS